MNRIQCVFRVLIVSVYLSEAGVGFAAYEKDPVKATQSQAVPVTEELLTREGEPGPASPTIRLEDTSKFWVKKPFEKAVDEKPSQKEKKAPWWERWFFSEKNEKSEPKRLEQVPEPDDATD